MAMRGLGSGRTDQDEAARPANDRLRRAQEDVPHEAVPRPATRPCRRGPAVTAGRADQRPRHRCVPGTGNNRGAGSSRRSGWSTSIAPVSGLFGHHHGVLWIAGGLAITLAFCSVYVAALVNWGGRPRLGRAGLAAIAVLAALACVVYGKNWTPLWIYVSAATGVILAGEPDGRRRALRGVLAVGACYVFFSWLSHDDATDFLVVLLPVLLIGVAMIGFRLQIGLMHELAQARETVAKLAANEERLRLARDMHDLTGQSLSVITLKSELAAKRLSKLPATARTRHGARRPRRHRPGQPADAARHQGGGQRLPPPHARDRGHHRAERAGRGRHPARRRPRADAALGHVRRRRRGRAGLVPARGGDQRDPALRREELPDPPDRTPRRTLPRGLRRRPRPQRRARQTATRPREPACTACPNACPPKAAACRSARPIPAPVGGHGFKLTATVPVDHYDALTAPDPRSGCCSPRTR